MLFYQRQDIKRTNRRKRAMQAVIMAGGKGTRLAALTKDEIPKPMIPLEGKPLLEWQIEELRANGITEIVMVIGYLGQKIQEYFKDGTEFQVQIQYVAEQEPLGTAGAFAYLAELIKEEYFLLVFGDVLFSIDLVRMEQFHQKKKAKATLFVHPNSHPFDSDLVELDSDDRICRLNSKKGKREGWYKNCVNAGCYMLSRELLSLVNSPVKTDLEKDIFMPLIEAKDAVYGYRSPEYIKDVGTEERIAQTRQDFANGLIKKKCLSQFQRCIFLDRDGTINRYKGLLWREEEFELEEGAAEAVRLINESGKLGICVTNQPSVARGLCQIEDIERIHRKMETLLGREGAYLDDIYFCPHHPDKGYPEENPFYKTECTCRKPKTGMIDQAVKQYHIDRKESWIIGDTTLDIQTGKNAGLRTVLLLSGEGGRDGKYSAEADLVCKNLLEAVQKILEKELNLVRKKR